jgi:hypothetical protein
MYPSSNTVQSLSGSELRVIEVLFGRSSEQSMHLTAQECLWIAEYLVRIHEKYKDFHHGVGIPRTQRLTFDVTQAYLLPGQRQFAIDNTLQLNGFSLTVSKEMSLRYARAIVLGKIHALEHFIPSTVHGDLYKAFRHYHIPYIYAPDIILNPGGFSEVYQDFETFAWEIGQGQLWLHFTNLLCDLTATIIGDPHIPNFDTEEARGSKMVRMAHNWYIECTGASEDLKAPLP